MTPPAKAHRKQLWIGILISAVLVILLAKGIDGRKLAAAFRHADYRYSIPMVLIAILGILIRAVRWGHIMASLHRASLPNLYSATMVGFMANFVLPARIGEFVRAYLIGRKERISKSAAFATIVVERLFDTLMIFLMLVAVLFLISRPGYGIEAGYAAALRWAGVTLSLLFLIPLVLLLFLKTRTQATLSVVEALVRPFPGRWGRRIVALLESFVTGLGAIRADLRLLWILVYSLLLWGSYGVGNDLMLRAFGMELPFYAPFYLVVVQAMGAAVPSSPGFIGTFHAAVVVGLAAFHVEQEKALSFAILTHFLLIVPIVIYGLVLLWKEHLSLLSLETEAARSGPEDPETG